MDKAKAIATMNKIHGCIMGMHDVGAQHVKVESLMDIEGFINPEKAKAIFEDVVELVSHLPKPFHDTNGGWTFNNIPTFAGKDNAIGDVWGTPEHAGALVLICAFYGIVQDPLHTLDFQPHSLDHLPNKASYFSFNIKPDFLDMVRRLHGLTSAVIVR
jgi:hypothetical protein